MPEPGGSTPLYPRLLGARFDQLDHAVQRFHRLDGAWRIPGCCTISGATHPLARLLARVLGLPRGCADAELHFELEAERDGETWTRRFPDRTMRSRLAATADGLLGERLGPARLRFRLDVDDSALTMKLDGIHVFGLPWPRSAFPMVHAREHGDGDRFHFDIDVRFGALGTLVAYRGHLDLDLAKPMP